jgi:HlyD family secretion protein
MAPTQAPSSGLRPPSSPLARRRTVWIIAGAIVVVGVLVLAFRPHAVSVETAVVKRGPMSAAVQDRGQTRVVDRYVISSPVAGNLERIPFQAGDSVKAGALVARLTPASLTAVGNLQARAAVSQAEAAVAQAQATLGRTVAQEELTSKDLRRITALHAQGIASQQDIDTARANEQSAARDAQAARAAIAQASANLVSARATLLAVHPGSGGVVELRAPVDSRIFSIPERSGRAVAPGDPIMTLGNPHEIEAVIDLLSEDAVKTTVGDRAFLIDWGGDHPLPGTVKNVEASAFTKISALGIEEQRVHVIVSIPDPPPTLGDGYRVQGRIVIWSANDAVQIPIGALTRFGTRWGTFVVDGGRARSRVLDIGHRNDETAEVLSGARAGEKVILHPSDAVADGVRVADSGVR